MRLRGFAVTVANLLFAPSTASPFAVGALHGAFSGKTLRTARLLPALTTLRILSDAKYSG